jgi:hypothetical protein
MEKPIKETYRFFKKKALPRDQAFMAEMGPEDPTPDRRLSDRDSTRIFQRVAAVVVLAQALYILDFAYWWILVMLLIFYGAMKFASSQSRKKAFVDQFDPSRRVPVGKYVTGFEDIRPSLFSVECLVGESYFVFISYGGAELGRIPRDGVNRVSVDDRHEMAEPATTMTRITRLISFLMTFGGGGGNRRYLLFDWNSAEGARQITLFEFTGSSAHEDAYAAVNTLYRYLKPIPEGP